MSYAQVIAAEGEQKASRALKEAAEVISQSPSALQLRYLQTLTQISAEKNSTIIFPIPVEMIKAFGKWLEATFSVYRHISVVLTWVTGTHFKAPTPPPGKSLIFP